MKTTFLRYFIYCIGMKQWIEVQKDFFNKYATVDSYQLSIIEYDKLHVKCAIPGFVRQFQPLINQTKCQ